MSTYGARFWDASGNLTFDSTADNVLFYEDERFIAGASVGSSGLTFDYPGLAGQKISALLQCPYGATEWNAGVTLSCRVSYPGGVPRVTVFTEGNDGTYTNADGYLVVMWTGSAL